MGGVSPAAVRPRENGCRRVQSARSSWPARPRAGRRPRLVRPNRRPGQPARLSAVSRTRGTGGRIPARRRVRHGPAPVAGQQVQRTARQRSRQGLARAFLRPGLAAPRPGRRPGRSGEPAPTALASRPPTAGLGSAAMPAPPAPSRVAARLARVEQPAELDLRLDLGPAGLPGTGSRGRTAGLPRRTPWHATIRSAVALCDRRTNAAGYTAADFVGPRTSHELTGEGTKTAGGAGGARPATGRL